MSLSSIIMVICEVPELAEKAKALVDNLHLPYTIVPTNSCQYVLRLTPFHLELQALAENAPGPVFVDFLQGPMAYRQQQANKRKELLARALGIKAGKSLTVLDATAGLGRDAFIAARLGCEVQCIERSPIVAALLQDGLNRWMAASSIEADKLPAINMRIVVADANDFMHRLSEAKYPDVVYLDPMYPERTKSALVKKELRILRDIVGEDLDAPHLLATALKCAKRRVVVKRPLHSPPLSDLPQPNIVYKGKTSRFDVYLT